MAAVAVRRLLDERHDVRVRHRERYPAVVVAREALAVRGGQSVEVVLGDEQGVVDLGDVAVELDADLDEPGHRGPQLVARLGGQVVAGAPDVAPREVHEPAQLAVEAGGLVGDSARAVTAAA